MINTEARKILVIDDEPGNIEAIIECLNESKYRISVATDGASGFKIAQKILPNLIITDWDMPGLSGIDTIKLIKSDEVLKFTPVIMATGKMLRSEDLKIALDAGADDYVRKPVDKVELIARTRSMILLYETMKKNIQLQKEVYYQKEACLNAKIEEDQKQLAYFTLKLVQQSEFNHELYGKLKEASTYSDQNGIKILNHISNQCRLAANQSYWTEFETAFLEVHPTYYDQINKQFPGLTKNEIKMAAFCKLNMSTKEVAAITFQSGLSLKKARQRLRKKLNINPETRLNEFFQQLKVV